MRNRVGFRNAAWTVVFFEYVDNLHFLFLVVLIPTCFGRFPFHRDTSRSAPIKRYVRVVSANVNAANPSLMTFMQRGWADVLRRFRWFLRPQSDTIAMCIPFQFSVSFAFNSSRKRTITKDGGTRTQVMQVSLQPVLTWSVRTRRHIKIIVLFSTLTIYVECHLKKKYARC